MFYVETEHRNQFNITEHEYGSAQELDTLGGLAWSPAHAAHNPHHVCVRYAGEYVNSDTDAVS